MMPRIVTSASPRSFTNASPLTLVPESRVFTKGTPSRIAEVLFHSRVFVVFGYTEYKGQQKEIFDAAINGVYARKALRM